MGRCPAMSDGERTKKFKVAPGHRIGTPNPELDDSAPAVAEPGMLVELTEAQAKYFLKKGAIELELDFGAEPKSDDSDKTEAGSGPKAEGQGADAAGQASGQGAVSEKGEGKVGGRKGSL